MTFSDIFKTNFMERINSFSLVDAVIALALAFIIGVFILVVYRKTYSGIMYNSGFGVSLVALSLVTSFIILAVTSNVVLSLGMVGALSIVRFRTAIKEPMDIVFLFWSIAAGIVLGAGLIPLAVIGSVIIGAAIYGLSKIKYKYMPYILVVRCSNDCKKTVNDILEDETERYLIKSTGENAEGMELIYEILVPVNSTSVSDRLRKAPGVNHVDLVSYNGEYMV